MYKKFISKTYLRGVAEYDIKIIDDAEYDCYIGLKRINRVNEPYIEKHTGKDVHLFDDGYYIIEYIPKNLNYEVRVFLNEKKQVLQYYIDITKENGFENDSPYYIDLFLDITIDKFDDDNIIIWDEDELLEALNTCSITEDDYDLAYSTLNNLLKEIDNNNNIYINRDHEELLNSNFN